MIILTNFSRKFLLILLIENFYQFRLIIKKNNSFEINLIKNKSYIEKLGKIAFYLL